MPSYNITVSATHPVACDVLVQLEADDSIAALRKALTLAKNNKKWPKVVDDVSADVIMVDSQDEGEGIK